MGVDSSSKAAGKQQKSSRETAHAQQECGQRAEMGREGWWRRGGVAAHAGGVVAAHSLTRVHPAYQHIIESDRRECKRNCSSLRARCAHA